MFPNIKEIKLSDGHVVKVFDMTIGLIDSIEQDGTNDTIENIILDTTKLSKEDIKKLRRNDAKLIYNTAITLTYPELYNADGTLKELPEQTENDKKKV